MEHYHGSYDQGPPFHHQSKYHDGAEEVVQEIPHDLSYDHPDSHATNEEANEFPSHSRPHEGHMLPATNSDHGLSVQDSSGDFSGDLTDFDPGPSFMGHDTGLSQDFDLCRPNENSAVRSQQMVQNSQFGSSPRTAFNPNSFRPSNGQMPSLDGLRPATRRNSNVVSLQEIAKFNAVKRQRSSELAEPNPKTPVWKLAPWPERFRSMFGEDPQSIGSAGGSPHAPGVSREPTDEWSVALYHRREVAKAPSLQPERDETIPRVLREDEKWVERLFKAMENVEQCLDKDKSPDLKKFDVQNFPSIASVVKAVCRELMVAAVSRAVHGFRQGTRAHDHAEKPDDDCLEDKFGTLQDRLTNIAKALQVDKRICRDVLNDFAKLEEFVNAPLQYAKTKIGNAKNNNKRTLVGGTNKIWARRFAELGQEPPAPLTPADLEAKKDKASDKATTPSSPPQQAPVQTFTAALPISAPSTSSTSAGPATQSEISTPPLPKVQHPKGNSSRIQGAPERRPNDAATAQIMATPVASLAQTSAAQFTDRSILATGSSCKPLNDMTDESFSWRGFQPTTPNTVSAGTASPSNYLVSNWQRQASPQTAHTGTTMNVPTPGGRNVTIQRFANGPQRGYMIHQQSQNSSLQMNGAMPYSNQRFPAGPVALQSEISSALISSRPNADRNSQVSSPRTKGPSYFYSTPRQGQAVDTWGTGYDGKTQGQVGRATGGGYFGQINNQGGATRPKEMMYVGQLQKQGRSQPPQGNGYLAQTQYQSHIQRFPGQTPAAFGVGPRTEGNPQAWARFKAKHEARVEAQRQIQRAQVAPAMAGAKRSRGEGDVEDEEEEEHEATKIKRPQHDPPTGLGELGTAEETEPQFFVPKEQEMNAMNSFLMDEEL
ncbi:hypothetical protein BCR34DRAFT_596308 [Clohesyomyces aquaticus]|uniref:Uncharacterized protein n=1 Tax=Clohesyomyces aquaticus TaxID=1231657 RepID=A0A1Y2A7D2_9PLEO|nr:hypothetical protein BCR34DRAFT_596308 [Clohesyomyces aquaticus]